MKQSELKQIIREEIQKVLNEADDQATLEKLLPNTSRSVTTATNNYNDAINNGTKLTQYQQYFIVTSKVDGNQYYIGQTELYIPSNKDTTLNVSRISISELPQGDTKDARGMLIKNEIVSPIIVDTDAFLREVNNQSKFTINRKVS